MPIMDKRPRMGETVTKAKNSNLPRINKMAIVAKLARVANGQNERGGQNDQWLKIPERPKRPEALKLLERPKRTE